MADESLFVRDRRQELATLARAKERNASRTVPVRVYGGVVYVTPQQAADSKYMNRLMKNYG